MTARSINAPGSPSSALQIRYFSSPALCLAAFHLNQVGNPAPPLPASPEILTVSITCSGVIPPSTFLRAVYPSFLRKSEISFGSIIPQRRRAILVCFLRNCESSSDTTRSFICSSLPSFKNAKIFSASSGFTLTRRITSPPSG